MTKRIWLRLRRWFGAGQSVPTLELALAHYGEPGERRTKSRSRSPREMLHPLQGWRTDPGDGMPVDGALFRQGARPSLPQSATRRPIEGRSAW